MLYRWDKSTLTRTCVAKYEVLDGKQILETGLWYAQAMWNQLICRETHWYMQLARICGKELARKATKYPGRSALDKSLRPFCLSDRCGNGLITEYDCAWQAFFTKKKKGDREARVPSFRSWRQTSLFFDDRSIKPLGNWKYRLTVLARKTLARHIVVKVHIRPGIQMRDIKTMRLFSNGKMCLTYEVGVVPSLGEHFAAVDLGIINQAVLAFDSGQSVLYSGKGYLAMDQLANKRISKCKPSGWESGRKEEHSRCSDRLRSYCRKRTNTRKLVCHNLTTDIIRRCKSAQVGTLIVGDLTGIREDKNWGVVGNQKLHAWPYAIITEMLKYKAEQEGIELRQISERGTSSHCHVCGEKGVRNPRGVFTCRGCGIRVNSDVNGAFGILNKVSPVAVKAIGVEANLPSLPSLEKGTGKDRLVQIEPACVVKYDLHNWAVISTK